MLIMMEIVVYASDKFYIKALANIIINHNIVMVVMMMVVVMVNGDEEMYPHLTVAINSATKCQF